MNQDLPRGESIGNARQNRSSMGVILIATLLGGLVGSYMWGPDVRENATPAPYVVTFALTALPVLIVLLLGRIAFFSTRK